ncbi:peptidoglycan DD-metalloendopeptidase family protein [Sphingobium sp. H39-3-25]|uniref:murein hydrolase activator EnvC family protein n=1 Tax=Sphingobium arseniciresistens TaxID=3030834 RepID=UPI0023BA2F28|nr:peptidoglycan DD-metalloendopeptidase family protein [Sphingobium arseniciresistens]
MTGAGDPAGSRTRRGAWTALLACAPILACVTVAAALAIPDIASGAGAGTGGAVVLPGLGPTSLAEERAALKTALLQANASRARSAQLDAQARQATEQAERARRHAAALAARIQESEADIQAAQARIAIIARLQRAQAIRLAQRQQPIARLTAALQTFARRPPALALVQPGSIRDAVHMRAVFDTVLPVIRERTAGLRVELARSRALQVNAQRAAASLTTGRRALAQRQAVLRRAEAEQRLASSNYRNDAGLEGDRAIAMGERARDIVDLMDKLEDAGDIRARLEALPGPTMRPSRPGEAQALPMGQAAMAVAPGVRSPSYRLPVVGTLVTGLGETSDSGVRSRGLTLATQPGAQVIAPSAGRVAFAGHYRGFGQIVILDHGDGWTSLITSMQRLSVSVGAQVRQGESIGNAGQNAPTITVELRHGGLPVDIISLVSL